MQGINSAQPKPPKVNKRNSMTITTTVLPMKSTTVSLSSDTKKEPRPKRTVKKIPPIVTTDPNVVDQTPGQQFAKQRSRNQRAFSEIFDVNKDNNTSSSGEQTGGVCVASTLGINVEICVYNYAIRDAIRCEIVRKSTHMPFVVIYTSRLRSVWWNLRTNPVLKEALCSGEITPIMLETMSHVELNMDKWKSEIQAKTLRDQSRYTNNQMACTEAYTCSRCHSKKCTFYAVQIRSSDEPMTVFVSCIDCGKNFTA